MINGEHLNDPFKPLKCLKRLKFEPVVFLDDNKKDDTPEFYCVAMWSKFFFR